MLNSMKCCGVHEVDGISYRTPKESLILIHKHDLYHKNYRGGFIIFTARYGQSNNGNGPEFKYGETFRDYILENKLGNVIESNPRPNQRYLNNGEQVHDLKVYIWEVQHEAFDAWYETNKPNDIKI